MLKLHNLKEDFKPEISDDQLTESEVLEELHALKRTLSEKMVVLGHHYQQDDIISLADITGDSLKLAQKAAGIKKQYIVFCGVHFMAETADMLTSAEQKVILPDLNAGCSMADMANKKEVDQCWKYLSSSTDQKIIPITYVNCSAELKAFVGKNEGSICTSSNAKKIISWALDKGEKLLFFPDQHLGRNTCFELGVPLEQMVIYDPGKVNGGLTKEQIRKAKVILWYGYCSVHQGFTGEQVQRLKKESPETKIIVHPECNFDVVQSSHINGSTTKIIETIAASPAGTSWAVGTEINLVNRLAERFKDKKIFSLSPFQCICTTMYRIRPRWLLSVFRSIKEDKPINVIGISDEIRIPALRALNTMLEIK